MTGVFSWPCRAAAGEGQQEEERHDDRWSEAVKRWAHSMLSPRQLQAPPRLKYSSSCRGRRFSSNLGLVSGYLVQGLQPGTLKLNVFSRLCALDERCRIAIYATPG